MRPAFKTIAVAFLVCGFTIALASPILEEKLEKEFTGRDIVCGYDVNYPTSISSPNYPGPYDSYFGLCRWKISTPDDNVQLIRITVRVLDTPAPSWGGCVANLDDILVIRGMPGLESHTLSARYCGSSLPAGPLYHLGSTVYVLFVMNSMDPNYAGFTLDVEFLSAPDTDMTTTTPTPTTTTTNTIQPNAWNSGLCGYSKYLDDREDKASSRIVNGNEVSQNELPYQVMILTYKDPYYYICGGSIINERWIMTAAHCIYGAYISDIRIAAGEHYRDWSTSTHVQYNAEGAWYHSNYTTLENGMPIYDIGMVKVDRPIAFDENIGPICPPDVSNLYVGDWAVVSGWGRTEYNELSDVLRAAALPLMSNNDCEAAFNNIPIPDQTICGDNDGSRGSCSGDSGGPVVVMESDGRLHLVGIVSWSIENCYHGSHPSGFIRVTYFMDFIDYMLANH